MTAVVEQLRPELKPHFLTKEDDLSWFLMPEYLRRVKSFAVQYVPDDNPEMLAKKIMLDFTDDQHVYCLPVILLDNEIVGHGLFLLRIYGETRYAICAQGEIDKGIEIEGVKGLVESLELWAHQNGCKGIEAWVDEGMRERALRVFHGFQRHKIVMRRAI